MKRLAAVLLLALPLLAADHYLFTSFRRNGETGIFFALSADGKQWTPLNGNQPWLAGMLGVIAAAAAAAWFPSLRAARIEPVSTLRRD